MNTPNQSSSPSAKPLVDLDQLQAACDGDAGVLRELVELYFRQAGEIMSGLDTAIRAGSIPDVDHLAHKLAGSSLACGMSAAVPPLRSLELGAKEGHLRGADALYSQTQMQLEVLRRYMDKYLAQLPKT